MLEADFVPFLSNPSDRYPDLALGAKSESKFSGRAHEPLRSRHFSPMNMLEDGYNIRKVQELLNTRLLTPDRGLPLASYADKMPAEDSYSETI